MSNCLEVARNHRLCVGAQEYESAIESLQTELASYMESDANLRKRVEELEAERTALEFKAKAYDAMCDVGLIQFGDDPETRCYSVWGFGAWHHDPDILKAIAAAMDTPILLGKEPAPSSPTADDG